LRAVAAQTWLCLAVESQLSNAGIASSGSAADGEADDDVVASATRCAFS
jgi:hypothetical protein